MERRTLLLIAILVVGGWWYYGFVSEPEVIDIVVTRVVDGDTIEYDGYQTVRLAGINTPERGMPDYESAKEALITVADKKEVQLYVTDVDRYGRTVGYLFDDKINLNEYMVEEGYAHAYYYEHDRYTNDIYTAEETARIHKKGIWEESPHAACLSLQALDYYDKGEDHETLTLINNCGMKVPVIIKDDATHIFKETIPEGKYEQTFKDTFNDNGDSLYVWDTDGKLIIFFRYA